MLRFLLEIIIAIFLAFLVYLTSLTLPRISEEEINYLKAKRSQKLIYFIEKSDVFFKSLSEKFLRKLKIWLLALNNFIEKKLSNFKKEPNKIEVPPENKKEENL